MSKEELNALKEEIESVNEKLQELTPEELEQVSGGVSRISFLPDDIETIDILKDRSSTAIYGSEVKINITEMQRAVE